MENYLYFRKMRPISASVTLGSATQTCPAFSAGDLGVLANNDNENEIAAISITSLDGGGTGHASVLFTPTTIVPTLAYSGSALAIAEGTTHWIEPSSQAYENGILVLDGHGTAGGYTLDTADIVTAYWGVGLETAFIYPVSAFKAVRSTDTNTSVISFASIKGDSTDDVITVEHANNGFDALCRMINNACNAHVRDGRLIKVIDGHDGQVVTLDGNNAAGITTIEFAPESGY